MIPLKIFHYNLDDAEETQLSSSVAEGLTSLTVRNNRGFSANDYIIVGLVGNENAESVKISSTSGDSSITSTTALLRSHNSDEPITRAKYDTIQIYRATSQGGTYTLLATVNIEWDQKFTTYIDTTGLSTYYYKWRFRNSQNTLASDYSYELPGSGLARNATGSMIDQVLKEIGDPNSEKVSRSDVTEWFNQVNDDMKSRLSDQFGYAFLEDDADVVTVASTETIDFPAGFDKIDYIEYNYVDSDTSTDLDYRLRPVGNIEFDRISEDNNADPSDDLKKYTIDELNEQIKLYPVPESDNLSLTVHFFRVFNLIDGEDDIPDIPNTLLYLTYAKAMGFRQRGTEFEKRADTLEAKYEFLATKIISRYKRRAKDKSPFVLKYNRKNNERRFYRG